MIQNRKMTLLGPVVVIVMLVLAACGGGGGGKAWGTAQLIETDNAGHAYAPQIAFSP